MIFIFFGFIVFCFIVLAMIFGHRDHVIESDWVSLEDKGSKEDSPGAKEQLDGIAGWLSIGATLRAAENYEYKNYRFTGIIVDGDTHNKGTRVALDQQKEKAQKNQELESINVLIDFLNQGYIVEAIDNKAKYDGKWDNLRFYKKEATFENNYFYNNQSKQKGEP